MSYLCPSGYDCYGDASCPSKIIDCPEGYYCGTYQNNANVKDIDYGYAYFKSQFDESITVTRSNYEDYIDANRQIQSRCIRGFYCPNATTILPCPSGYWCNEGAVTPIKCDGLSACGEMSYFEVNFVNVIIALIVSCVIAAWSYHSISKQRKNEVESRKFDYKTHQSHGSLGNIQSERSKGVGIEVLLINYSYEVIDTNSKDILKNNSYSNIKLISNVTSQIRDASITCILGPSGCGKSIFLDLIRRKQPSSNNGSINIYTVKKLENENGVDIVREEVTDLFHSIGYVPQDDVIDRNLTVRELLLFNAALRVNKPFTDIERIVEDVLIELHIRHVADTIIGGSANSAANVSGGQLKRINIAMELVSVTRPSLLLLDEPTSGLDASIANELFESLYHLSRTGITVVAALQQPRQEIYYKMDKILVMSLGGHIVYDGPPQEAAHHFQSLGYKQEPASADADYLLDVLNGLIPLENHYQIENQIVPVLEPKIVDASIDVNYGLFAKLILHWNQLMIAKITDYESIKDSITLSTPEISKDSKEEMWRKVLVFSKQTYWNFKRAISVRLRKYSNLLVYAFVQVIMAIALSTGFSIYLSDTYIGILDPTEFPALKTYFPSIISNQENKNHSSFGLAQLLFFMSVALGQSSALTAVPLLAGRQNIIQRESLAGMSSAAHGVGTMLADAIFVYWNALIFLAIWMLFAPAGHWYDWHACIVCIAFAASGWGYFAAVISRAGSSSFVALIITLIFCVFSGVDPTFKQVQRLPIVNWPWYLSYATWTSESIYYTVSQHLQIQSETLKSRVEEGAKNLGYQVTNFGNPIGALIGLGFLARAVVVFVLLRYETSRTGKNKSK